ncbi:MAG: hypothetical protein A3E56_00065 [Omnitrophica WOR_2 bacterium RIFCSPHIGHO2_12_FULL_64_13]|nr:MAG: hypothetical protein A3E56_00065 [Omnitrophica WOR_2 bacterium RIFCSPHIGHO2_12_FULL_64_13]
MGDPLHVYREAIAARVQAICIDRNLDPASAVETEAGFRIERFLPQLVELAKAVGPGNLEAYNAMFESTVCLQCGNRDALGVCRMQEQAACCLYRYLPLLYDAIHSVPPAGR